MQHTRAFYALMICALLALTVAPAAAQADPTATVDSFYNWYLDYAGYDEAAQEFRNPLADGSYQQRPELAARLIDEVTALGEEQGGYGADPFLCAQDVPESFDTELIDLMGQSATVMVSEYFAWNPRPNRLTVALADTGEGWQIDSVNCQESITARGVTESFYAWYLSQPHGSGQPQSGYPWLTDELNARLREARPQELGGGDPILCAQDYPASIAVDEVMVGGDEATMLVREFFAGNPQPHTLTVSLRHDTQWQIDTIACEVTPETVAALLYSEFITFASYDMQRGLGRKPIADWSAYPWAQYMGEHLLTDLLAQYRSGEARPADPFLCAQDVPSYVTVERIAQADSEHVTLRIAGAYPSGPDTFTSYDLAEVEMALAPTGDWQMVAIACAR